LIEPRKSVAKIPDRILLHLLPELLQPRQAVFGLVAGNHAGIDGADRGADDPVRLDASLVQRLVDASLIGPQRAAALQHQHDLSGIVPAQRFQALRSILYAIHVLLPFLLCSVMYAATAVLLRRPR